MTTTKHEIKTPELDKATKIGSTTYRGAEYKTDLFANWTTLYRSRGGKFFLYRHGGGGIRLGFQGYVTRSEAIDWLCEEKIAFHEDGIGREQAATMCDAK